MMERGKEILKKKGDEKEKVEIGREGKLGKQDE